MQVTLTLERETKNTYRYQEVEDDKVVIGTLYIKKSAMRRLVGDDGPAEKLTVTIEEA